jgi:uncharacterized membrane protein YbhN (UPF0104 family)
MPAFNDPKQAFQVISYLQYPFMVAGLLFCVKPIVFAELSSLFSNLNIGLAFFGLGISFSTLQDTTKTQNDFSKRIYQNPKRSRIFLMVIFLQVLFFSALGLIGLFQSAQSPLNEIALGLISVGIGLIGVLKAAGEMAQHHRSIVEE